MFDRRGLTLLSITILLSCGGNSLDAVTGGGDSDADRGSGSGGAGSGGVSGTGGAAVADAGASVGSGGASAGSGGASGPLGSADAGGNDGPAPAPIYGNGLTGTLGTLGKAKSTVAAFTTNIGRQALIYLSSAPLTCAQIMTPGWLSSATAGSQVVELVLSPAPVHVGTFPIGAAGGAFKLVGALNYAAGGDPSANEVMAKSGWILLVAIYTDGRLRGRVNATLADGSSLYGDFNAPFCAGGQHY